MATEGALAGRVVIVTGAGRGIGREIALLAAQEGAKVVVNDLGGSAGGEGASTAPAEEVAGLIRERGGSAVPNFDSVAEPGSASNIVKTALDAFGRLDGVVNNAGILRDAIFHKMSVADFELVIKVHLLGSFYVSHAAARIFREQESGAFVHFTSTSGLVGNFGQANYAAAKAALIGFTKALAHEYARKNVTVNAIAPGFIKTQMTEQVPEAALDAVVKMTPVGRLGEPEEVAAGVAYLASDAAAFVTGHVLDINGGYAM